MHEFGRRGMCWNKVEKGVRGSNSQGKYKEGRRLGIGARWVRKEVGKPGKL